MHHGIDETHFFLLKSVKDMHNFSATAMQLFCILPFYGFVSSSPHHKLFMCRSHGADDEPSAGYNLHV